MNRYTVAVLVNNQFGVLNRVTSMFRRRQFNIISLTVSETESNALSRITVTFEGGETQKQQLVNQLYKLPDVSCELMLIKLKNDSKTRSDILAAADAFGAKTMDYSKDSLMLCLTSESRKIDEFVDLMRDYEILEICRTGNVSLEKGSTTIRQAINF